MATAVLIRAHNHGALLPDALDSVLRQSLGPDDVVVVDDGSSDDTSEVIERYRRRCDRIRSIRNESPVGPAEAMNQAVSASRSEILLPLDADDRLSDRFIELTERALATSRADVAYGRVRLFGAKVGWVDAPAVDHAEMRIENQLPVSCSTRRWVFDRSGGFDSKLDGLAYEDWDFWLTALEMGAQFEAVEGCWLEYRQHQNQSRNTIGHLAALKAHLSIYRAHPSVTAVDLCRWMARSVRRNLPGDRG